LLLAVCHGKVLNIDLNSRRSPEIRPKAMRSHRSRQSSRLHQQRADGGAGCTAAGGAGPCLRTGNSGFDVGAGIPSWDRGCARQNTIRIEFEPADMKKPYIAQLRWATVTDQVSEKNQPGKVSGPPIKAARVRHEAAHRQGVLRRVCRGFCSRILLASLSAG